MAENTNLPDFCFSDKNGIAAEDPEVIKAEGKRIVGKAYDLFKEKDWVQGCLAKNDSGDECDSYAKEAVSFCLVGALEKSSPSPFCYEYQEAIRIVARQLGQDTWHWGEAMSEVLRWNDVAGRTKQEVLELLEKAA